MNEKLKLITSPVPDGRRFRETLSAALQDASWRAEGPAFITLRANVEVYAQLIVTDA